MGARRLRCTQITHFTSLTLHCYPCMHISHTTVLWYQHWPPATATSRDACLAGSDAGEDASGGPEVVLDEEDEDEAQALGGDSGSEGARSLDGFIVRDEPDEAAATAG